MTDIRDPIYGYLELSDEELRVLDSQPLQRLRNIRQLGFSSLVYPGATHTRFEHSLGVMHLAGEFSESLNLNNEDLRTLRMAGLLHDTGHGPFSHASEIMCERKGRSHEYYSCEKAEMIDDRHSLDTSRIKDIIRGESDLGRIVAGDIDSDRMDYLMRDAHASGLEHGKLDYETIIRCAKLEGNELVFSEKAVDALEALFTSRFHMLKTLYFHHTAQIAEEMAGRALENLHDQGYSIDQIMRMNDTDASAALKNSEGVSKRLYSRIESRRLFKRALVWGPDDLSRKEIRSVKKRMKRDKVEREIAEKAGVDEWKVIVDLPEIPEIQSIDVNIQKQNGTKARLSDISPIPEALTEAEWRTVDLRVYAPENERENVGDAAEKVISDYSNVLDKYLG